MKYLLVQMVNPTIDACLHHESGIATCSDGGDTCGVPWVFTEHKLFNSRKEAEQMADKLFLEQYERLNESIFEKSGWIIAASEDIDGCKMWLSAMAPRTLFLYRDIQETCECEWEWLYQFSVLEVKE